MLLAPRQSGFMDAIQPTIPPSGDGCQECLESGDWWLHLRRCAQCGHVGCCDSSPSQHATLHAVGSTHPIAQSYEPGEDWFWDYSLGSPVDGVPLVEPSSHPLDQPVPGPRGKVPEDWQTLLH
jgi:hypothetical protein